MWTPCLCFNRIKQFQHGLGRVAHTPGQESLDSLSAPGILALLMLAHEEHGSEGTLAGVVWLNPALTQAALVWDQVIVL